MVRFFILSSLLSGQPCFEFIVSLSIKIYVLTGRKSYYDLCPSTLPPTSPAWLSEEEKEESCILQVIGGIINETNKDRTTNQ